MSPADAPRSTPRAGCASEVPCGTCNGRGHFGSVMGRVDCTVCGGSGVRLVPPASAPAATPEPRAPKPHIPWTPTWEPPERPFHRCDLCGATDTSLMLTPDGDTRRCIYDAGHSGEHLSISPFGVEHRWPAATPEPEPDTFQMAGDVLSGKRRIEDVLAELRPTGEEAETPDLVKRLALVADNLNESWCEVGAPHLARDESVVREAATRLTAQATALAALRADMEAIAALPCQYSDGSSMCFEECASCHARAALAPRQPTGGRDVD